MVRIADMFVRIQEVIRTLFSTQRVGGYSSKHKERINKAGYLRN